MRTNSIVENAEVVVQESIELPRGPMGSGVIEVVALVSLFTPAAVVEALRLSSLHNPDIWLHLRVGHWILTNRTWPVSGLFSQSAGLPWRDFCWAGDAGMAMVYRILGLSAVPLLWMVYRLLIAAITFFLAGGSRDNLWFPAILSGVSQYLLYRLGPQAGGNSALLFAVEFLVLLSARRSGVMRPLLWLPGIFLLWANVDVGFVYGIGLFGLFVLSVVIDGRLGAAKIGNASGKQTRMMFVAFAATLLASVLTPYGYHPYPAFFEIHSSPVNDYLAGSTAMTFHQAQDYALLLLAMAAFLSLGLRRSRDLFLLAALIVSTALSFYAQGENWLAIVAAVAVLGEGFRGKGFAPAGQKAGSASWKWFLVPAAGSCAAVLLLSLFLVPRGQSALLSRVQREIPMAACDYIREHRLPAPLFNSYEWGSFLTWYLPEYPVAIDARRGLYPKDMETDYFKVMRVDIPYQSLEPMRQASTLLLDKKNVMAEGLRSVRGFHVAYEDSLAMVLVQENRRAELTEERHAATAGN